MISASQVKTTPLSATAAPGKAAQAKAAHEAGPPLSPEELLAIEAAAQNITSQIAASYWEKADEAEIDDERSDMLSWEQAAKLGLLPPPP
jgi:hypothetical protein